MKDQGKISELNISSHRYQTSESEGQPPELLVCENLAMDLLNVKLEDPSSSPAAPKSGELSPVLLKSSSQRTPSSKAQKARAKLRRVDQQLSLLDQQSSDLDATLDALPDSIGRWRFAPDPNIDKPDSKTFTRRQKHYSYCSFLALVGSLRQYKPKPDGLSYALFESIYYPDGIINRQKVEALDLSLLNYRPNKKLKYKSYLEFLTILGADSPVKIKDDQRTYQVFETFYHPGVVVNRQLLSKVDLTSLYRPPKSSGKKRAVKTPKAEAHHAKIKGEYDRYFSNMQINVDYTPQSGIETDDGTKFLGKVKPKSGSPPDKPATSDAPGISSVINGPSSSPQLRFAPPKPTRKDPNDGPLNGFGIGI